MKKNIIFTLLLTFLLLGCEQNNNIKFNESKTKTVENFYSNLLSNFYSKKRRDNPCYIYKEKTEEQPNYYCMTFLKNETKVVDGKNIHFITFIGNNTDENGIDASSHVSSGVLRFLMIGEDKDTFKIISDSGNIKAGSLGQPPKDINLIKINKNDYAWQFSEYDIHQGYEDGFLSIYANIDAIVKPVLDIRTLSSNDGATNIRKEIYNSKANIKTSNSGGLFYNVTASININKYGEKSQKEFNFTYDENKKLYNIPEEYNKQFEEH